MGAIVTEAALVESRSMRDASLDRVEALDRVKALRTLPDDLHVTTEMVATYFEVDVEAIRKVSQRNRAELVENGMRVLRGDDLRVLKDELAGHGSEGQDVHHWNRVSSLSLFVRRTVLNVAMLLRDSAVARDVRTALLDTEEASRGGAESPTEVELANERLTSGAIVRLARNRLIDYGTARELVRRDLEATYGTLPAVDPSAALGSVRPKRTKVDTTLDDILAVVRDNPGITANRICLLVRHSRPRVLAALHGAVEAGTVAVEAGPNRSRCHRIAA